jgi:hypothetical protein
VVSKCCCCWTFQILSISTITLNALLDGKLIKQHVFESTIVIEGTTEKVNKFKKTRFVKFKDVSAIKLPNVEN